MGVVTERERDTVTIQCVPKYNPPPTSHKETIVDEVVLYMSCGSIYTFNRCLVNDRSSQTCDLALLSFVEIL